MAQRDELVECFHLWLLGLWLFLPWPKSVAFLFSLAAELVHQDVVVPILIHHPLLPLPLLTATPPRRSFIVCSTS